MPALLFCNYFSNILPRLGSPDLFDGRVTDAPRPTYWLDGIADRCISGTALILFLTDWHVSDPALNILIYCIPVSCSLHLSLSLLLNYWTFLFFFVNMPSRLHKTAQLFSQEFPLCVFLVVIGYVTSCARFFITNNPFLPGHSATTELLYAASFLLKCSHYQGSSILLKRWLEQRQTV